MDKKNYVSIDVMKFICAILIISLHTGPFATYNKYISFLNRNILTIIAVPFFFIASSFLFFKKAIPLDNKIKNTLFLRFTKRISVMYIIWSAIYFIFVVQKWVSRGWTLNAILLYIRDFFFVGSYETIWFLPALLSATAIVFYLLKIIKINSILIISFVFYAFALLGSSYHGITTNIPFLDNCYDIYFNAFTTIKNGLFFGFPYVAIGAFIAQYEFKLVSKNNIFYAILFSFLMVVEEIFLTKFKLETNGVDTKLFLLPVSFFLFMIVVNIKLPDNLNYKMFRDLSLLMFLSQRLFLTILPNLLHNIGFGVLIDNSIAFFAIILISTIFFSYLIILLSNKIKFFKLLL